MKAVGVLVLLSLFLVSIGAVNALQPSSISLTIPSNSNSLYNISFYNDQLTAANVTFNIGTARIENAGFFSNIGVSPVSFLLGPGQYKYVLFSFVPNGKVSSYPVAINITYTQNGATKSLLINAPIVPIQDLISSVSAPATVTPPEALNFSAEVLNVIGQNSVINLFYQVNNSLGQTIASVSSNVILTNLGLDQFSFSVPLNGTSPAGNYSIAVWTNYGGQVSSNHAFSSVQEYKSLSSTSSSNYNIFGGSSSVTITNTGNENVLGSELTLPISGFNSVFLASKSVSLGKVQLSNGAVTTDLAALAPGQSITISYTVSYWPLYLIAAIIVIAIVLFLLLNRKVAVSKEVVEYKLANGFVDVKIAVKVKNIARKVLKDLVVVDLVPAHALRVASVGPKEGKITKGIHDMNIVWREVELQPNDEILLMYEIKSKMGIVGNIDLKSSIVSFTYEGKDYRKNSNSLVLHIK